MYLSFKGGLLTYNVPSFKVGNEDMDKKIRKEIYVHRKGFFPQS